MNLLSSGLIPSESYFAIELNESDAIFIPEGKTILITSSPPLPTYYLCSNIINLQYIILFIGWWHLVTSSECSVALNYWFKSPLNIFLSNSAIQPYMLRTLVHEMTMNQLSPINDDNCKYNDMHTSKCIHDTIHNSMQLTTPSIYSDYLLFSQHIGKMIANIHNHASNQIIKLECELQFVNCTEVSFHLFLLF